MEGEFKLFVSNVPYNCTEEEFRNFMMALSPSSLKDVRLVKKSTSEVNQGFGFVTLLTQESMEAFKKQEVIFNGRKLQMSDYVNQQKFYKIHVMNVPEALTEQMLFDMFSQFGKVDSVKRDFNFVTKVFKGTAMVVFTNYEDFNTVLTKRELVFSDDVKVTVTKRRLPLTRKFGVRAPLHVQRQQTTVQPHEFHI